MSSLSEPESDVSAGAGPGERVASTRRVDRLAGLAYRLRYDDAARALGLAERACALAEARSYRRGLAEGLFARAFAHFTGAAYDRAQADVRAAQGLFERLNCVRGVHKTLNLQGMIYGDLSRFGEALELFLALYNRCREHADVRGEADALNNAALVCTYLSDYPNALELYLQSLALAETLDDPDKVASTSENIGLVYLEMGHFAAALAPFERALELRRGRASARDIATLMNLGRVYEGLGDLSRALSASLDSLAHAERHHDPGGMSYGLDTLGSVYTRLGEPARALPYLERARALKVRDNDRLGEVKTNLLLGRLHFTQAHYRLAADVLDAARTVAEAVGSKAELYKAHGALAETYEALGDYPKALEHHKAFVRTKDEVFSGVSDHRLQSLRVVHEIRDKEREKEIVRLRNVELVRANDELRRVQAVLERQAREDPLTGLYNRRYLEPQLRAAFERARRTGEGLAVMICDVDNFKRINDRFSHELGDRVLVRVAELLRGPLRPADVLARYGGEEFVLFMPGLYRGEALELCERLRAAVENHAWRELHFELQVTVSMGVCADLTLADHEKMVAGADRKLYEAKRTGKNRVL